MTELSDFEIVSHQLGRPAYGFQEVVCRRADGTPVVIRVDSFVTGQPFPTLFWLTDTELNREVGLLESKGLTTELQTQIDVSELLKLSLRKDNLAHIKLREKFMNDEIRSNLKSLNCYDDFQKKGIGGNANFSRVRCLHSHIAAHLVVPNTVGKMLVEHLNKTENPLRELIEQLTG